MRRPLLPVCLCLVMLSAFLHYAGEVSEDSPPPGGQVSVTGYIYQKDDTSFYLKIQDAANLSGQEDSKTNLKKDQKTLRKGCRIICESEEKVLLGSVVVLRGEFEAFSGATNPGEFDYANYYHSLGLTGRVRKAEILNRGGKYSRVSEMLYSLRSYWKGRLYRIFPEKEASVMTAVLLGDKSGLDEGVRELYRSNGIIHILSISGVCTLSLVSLRPPRKPVKWAFVQVYLRKFTLFYLAILGEFCPLVVLPLFRGCFSKITNWQKKIPFCVSKVLFGVTYIN